MSDLLKDEDLWGAATSEPTPTLSDSDIWGSEVSQPVLSDADIWGSSSAPGEQPAGIGDYASELGRATVRGVASTANSTARGLGVLTSDSQGAIADAEKGIADLPKMSADARQAFYDSLPQKLSPVVAFNYQVGIRKLLKGDKEGAQSYFDTARKYIDTTPVEKQSLSVGGQQLEDATNEAFPQDPRFKGSVTSDIGQALGSSAFFLPIGLLTGGTGVAFAGAAAGADQSHQQAQQSLGRMQRDRLDTEAGALGPDKAEQVALEAGRLGAFPGASEVVPTEIFLEQMPKFIPGLRTIANTPVWGKFAKAFGRIGTQVLSEGGQEAFQQWASNVINKLKVDPDQDVTEGVLYNALLGGIVGGGMQVGVEGYNAVRGHSDEAQQPNGGPINVSPQPGAPGGPRIEPQLFRDQASPPPGATPPGAPPPQGAAPAQTIPDDAYLLGAGYTPEQISDMNPDERAAAVEEAQAQGVEPLDVWAGSPQPGTAPMAPRGTRRDRVNVQSEQDLEQVRPTVNAEPSPAQAAAGNYQKGHINIHGLDVSIENPKGSLRKGTDEDGADWQSPVLPADYGYIRGTTGKDGDHVDVYIGPNPQSDRVYVIDQMDPKTGKFDEHKAVMGADSLYHAEELYSGSFTNPVDDQWQTHRRIGAITEMSVDEFKKWVKEGRNTKRPASKSKIGIVTQGSLQNLSDEQVGIAPATYEPPKTDIGNPTSEPAPGESFDSIFQQELDAEYGATPATQPDMGNPISAPAPSKKRKYGAPKPVNLLDFIASIGGIQDPTGELKGMDLPKMGPFGPPVRKNGLHPDKVREALVERGFLHDRGHGTDQQASTTENDVYDLIAQHMGGQRVYAPEDQARAEEIATTKANSALKPDDWVDRHPIEQRWGADVWNAVQEVFELTDTTEESWSLQMVADAARLIAEGMTPGEAFERAAVMQEEADLDPETILPEVAEWMQARDKDAMDAYGEMPPFPDVETPDVAAQEPQAESPSVSPAREEGQDAGGEASDGGQGGAEVGAGETVSEGGAGDTAGQDEAGLDDEVDPEEARKARVAEWEDFQKNHQHRIESETLADPRRPHAVHWAQIQTLEVEPGQFTAAFSANFPESGSNGLPSLEGTRYGSKAQAQAAMAQKIIGAASMQNGKQAQMIREWAGKFASPTPSKPTKSSSSVTPIQYDAIPNPVNGKEVPAEAKPEERLLLMACSGDKADVKGEVSPIELYTGAMYQVLKKYMPGMDKATVRILSAKHGILSPEWPKISHYEERLSKAKAKYLVEGGINAQWDDFGRIKKGRATGGTVRSRLAATTGGPAFKDVFIAGGSEYRGVFHAWVKQMQDAGMIAPDAAINEVTGGIGEQRSKLGAYLRKIAGEEPTKAEEAPAPAAEEPPAWAPKVGEIVALRPQGGAATRYRIKEYKLVDGEWLFKAEDGSGGGFTDSIETLRPADKGADNKQQLVIPGAEQDQKGAMQNAANKPLRAATSQKPMDVGLFGSERDQADIFDQPKQRDTTDRRDEARPIADEIEKLDNPAAKGFANGMRGAINGKSPVTADMIAFYKQRLADFRAQDANTGVAAEKPAEARTLESHIFDNPAEVRLIRKVLEATPALTSTQAMRDANRAYQRLAAWINDQGFKVNDVNSFNASAEIKKGHGLLGGLAGSAMRVAKSQDAVSKGYERGSETRLTDDIKQLRSETIAVEQFVGTDETSIDDALDAAIEQEFGPAPKPKIAAPERRVIQTGVILRTKSGRETSPAPKIEATSDRKTTSTLKRMYEWLLDEAKKEVAGNDYQSTLLRGINVNNLSQSDQDTINDLLFGNPDGATQENVVRVEKGGKPKTAGQAATDAVKNTAMGIDQVAKGLQALFGDKNKLNSGFTFDEQTYAQAKPFFKAGAAHLKEAGKNMQELALALVRALREAGMTADAVKAMTPYLKRFMEDIRDGKETLDAPGSSEILEPDRGDAAAGDAVGAADVPAAGGADGSGAGSRGAEADQGNRRRRGGRRLPQIDAPVVGEDGHLELPAREPRAPGSDAADGKSVGGPESGSVGLPDDRLPLEEAAAAVRKDANVGFEEKLRQQQAAEKLPSKPRDLANIRATLPILTKEQQEDVLKVEERYNAPEGHGVLITNGTGTGKTFSGLGVVKRFARRGKKNILIVAPSQGILLDWQKAAKHFGLDLHILESTQDKGKGITATTYANLGDNPTLADREWDLIVTDESHKLSSDKDGTPTAALQALRAATLHPDGLYRRGQMAFRKEWDAYERLKPTGKNPSAVQVAAADEAYAAWRAKYDAALPGWREAPRSKVLMLSATPFAYHFSLDYAEGYLFKFGEDSNSGAYNAPSGRSQFYISNFGYQMKTGKLNKPGPEVDTGVMERQFHEQMKRTGALFGRALEVEKDYDRKFLIAESAIGTKIDQALEFLSGAENGRFRALHDVIYKKFDYLTRMRLLEAIKAEASIPYIKKSLALGRKIVVFHDYNEGGGTSPFHLKFAPGDELEVRIGDKVTKVNANDLYQEFLSKNPYVKDLDFAHYQSPIEAIQREFPDALIYNGTVSTKKRDEAKRLFNDDNSGRDIIVVQSAAGEAGISLHDLTGKKQRVLLNLGMPVRPTTALQEEGRIYRVGQQSDAIFRYMNTGTNWERWTFGAKIAERSSTAENLAMGDQARAIKQSFIDAFNNADDYPPTIGEGTGGKQTDRASNNALSEFERAKTHYFANQKLRGRRDQREGIDYFPTPEPLGLKMVEWANIKPGEKILEPSAGHGAIARYFPETTARTLVEPSSELASRAALNSAGARIVVSRFEDLDIVNKYDAIVMNPPFGVGGKTAIDHLEKAAKHLKNGGRIVALLPTGPAADKRLDAWYEEAEGIYMVGRVDLPPVTFERAGTSIRAQVIILEKHTDKDVRPAQQSNRDFSSEDTIRGLFDRLENTEFDPRTEPKTKELDLPTTGEVTLDGITFELTNYAPEAFDAKIKTYVPSRFRSIARAAEAHGGFYLSSIKSFSFKTEAERRAFLEQVAKGLQQVESAAAAPASSSSAGGGTHNFRTAEVTHAKTGKPLFVATLQDRVSPEIYQSLNAIAKRHGGYYSSFRGNGAVPGFQFPSDDARSQFLAETQAPPQAPLSSRAKGVASSRNIGLPSGAAVITGHITTEALNRHPRYREAKAGGIDAAISLVSDLATDDMLAKAHQSFGPDHIFVPVTALERSGENRIPNVLARFLAEAVGGSTDTGIYQSVKAGHTQASPIERLLRRPRFAGPVQAGARYVLVDDVTVMGGTLAELADHIRANGGQVDGVVTLVNTSRNGLKGLTPAAPVQVKDIERRFGDEVRSAFDIEPSALTFDEAQYLRNFRDADRLRARIAAARRTGGGRVGEEGVSERSAPDEGPQGDLNNLPRRQDGRNPYRFVINQRQTAELVHEIGQIAERILGHSIAGIEVYASQEAWNETFGEAEDAVFDPNTGVISIALHGTQDLRSTLRHEAVHALRQAGVISAREWAVLSRMAQSRWIDQYKIRDRYEQLYRERFDISEAELELLLTEEAIADAMGEHWTKAPAEDVISRIFARIKAFLAALRQALRGKGYTSAAQIAEANAILNDIEKGAMARRQPGTGQGRDFMLYARQSEQADLSSRRHLAPPRNPTPGSFEAPHDERVRRALADSTDTLLNRLRRAGRAFGNEFRRKTQDREVDLLRTQNAIEQAGSGPLAEPQNAYLAASLYPGRTAQRDKDLVDDFIEPLVKDIARRGLSLEDVNDFVMARHAIERNLEVGQLHKPGSDFHEAMTNPAIVGASGLSENEASDILSAAQQSGKFADLEAVGDKIVALNRRTLAKLYAEGLITQEQYDALTLKYQYYVPLRGFDDVTDESHPDSPRTGRRYDIRGREFQQAFGRKSKADNPLAYSIMQARQAIVRIEKNRVGKRFLRLAQANPNAAFWEVNRVDLKKVVDERTGYVRNVFDRGAAEAENVYAVKVGGKRYNITLHHEGLLRAMKGIGGENMGDLVGMFHKINRFFAMLNTSLDPEFIFRNFIRDLQHAGIVIQEEKAKGLTTKILASLPKAAYGMNQMLQGRVNGQWARYAREFADAGGKIGFMDRGDIDREKGNLERLMKEATAGWTGKTLKAANDLTLERLARYNDTIENTLRLSTYVALRQAGATKDRAAFVARELTVNFNRKGEWGPALNAFYLFFNASMQGAASLFMRLGRSRKMKAVAAGIIVEAFLMDILNRMIGGDDDDDKNRYDKIPPEEKARNHIFMMPKWFEDKYGVPYFKLPLPLGWNWFNVVGQQASAAVAGAVSPLEAFGNIAGTFADSFNPLGSGSFLSTVAPTLLDPFVEIGTNKDYFGEKIVPRTFDETTPYAERYKPNVNPAAKWLTDHLSQFTGGSPERPGAVDISPEWVEHLADFTFGGLGRFFTRSMTAVDSWLGNTESDAGKVPFQRVFVGRDSTFADRDEYFEIRDAVHITEKELKGRLAEHDREAADEVKKDHAREVKMFGLMDTAEKRLTKLRKQYKAVKNAQGMGEAARAKRLEDLGQQMDEIQRKVRTRWHQLGKDGETAP